MTPIVHWDRCSNLQVTNDQGKNCSRTRVNPKFHFFFRVVEGQVNCFLSGYSPGSSIESNRANIAERGEFFSFLAHFRVFEGCSWDQMTYDKLQICSVHDPS